jgi:hypothetical protein
MRLHFALACSLAEILRLIGSVMRVYEKDMGSKKEQSCHVYFPTLFALSETSAITAAADLL